MMSSYDDQDRETYDRRQEQLLRERMLDGQHEDDIINEIKAQTVALATALHRGLEDASSAVKVEAVKALVKVFL